MRRSIVERPLRPLTVREQLAIHVPENGIEGCRGGVYNPHYMRLAVRRSIYMPCNPVEIHDIVELTQE
jgi:hypothetical protein